MPFLFYLGTIHFTIAVKGLLIPLPDVDVHFRMTGYLIVLRLRSMAYETGGKKLVSTLRL